GDAVTQGRRDFFRCVSVSRHPGVIFSLRLLCGKNLPKIPEHDQRQRHAEQQTPLRHKQNLKRIAPTELVTDRVFLRQVPKKIQESFSRVPIISEKPQKAETAAEKQKRGCQA